MNQKVRRVAYFCLCALPFIGVLAASARPLRTAGLSHLIGGVLFTVVVLAVALVARVTRWREAGAVQLALAGLLLTLPWAIVSLLWVGIGAPFQATLSENYMRFVVLVWNSIFVTCGFVVLKQALDDAGERLYSALGLATAICAGGAYLICLNLSLAQVALALRGDQTTLPPILVDFYGAIEFVACVMTYATTAAFAGALGRAGFLARGAARTYVVISTLMVVLIVTRGLAYPEISGNTAPWYTRPGVIAGIPAIPWFMPCLLGAVLLRRAGERQESLVGDDTMPCGSSTQNSSRNP